MSSRTMSWATTIAVVGMLLFVPGTSESGEPIGPVTREQVARKFAPEGGDTLLKDEELTKWSKGLGKVEPGANVTVFFGWNCRDSKREIPRLLALLKGMEGTLLPFAIKFVAVSEDKSSPARELQANEVHYLPTMVVSREGSEVGRIVERPARGLQTDLLRLLDGSARGLLSSDETAILDYLRITEPRPTSNSTTSRPNPG